MKKNVLKASFLAILFGTLCNIALAEDKSCCTISGAGSFTLSEEDKAALQDKNQPNDSKTSQEINDQSNKEKQ